MLPYALAAGLYIGENNILTRVLHGIIRAVVNVYTARVARVCSRVVTVNYLLFEETENNRLVA